MRPKIVGHSTSLRVRQVLAAAECAACELDVTETTTTGPVASAPVGPLFAEECVLVTSEGSKLFSSAAAVRYFARMRPDLELYGRTFDEMAQVDGWLHFGEMQLMVPVAALAAWQGAGKEKIHADILAAVDSKMEAHLLSRTFLVGERISVADVSLALALDVGLGGTWAELKARPNTARWLRTVLGQTAVKKFVSSETATAVVEKAKPLEEGAEKEKKPKPKEQKPKEKAEKPSKKEAAAESEGDEEEKPKPKKLNPLDQLPATTMVLDAWKREFSNTKDFRGKAMPWFWQNFDSAGWSLWHMRYEKEEGENTVGYATANMLGGFLQRLDTGFRKYSFGVTHVVGESGNFDIQGIWLLRGHEIPFELKDHPSFEYYTFRRLDPVSDRPLIDDYWCNEDQVEGRRIDSSKVWK